MNHKIVVLNNVKGLCGVIMVGIGWLRRLDLTVRRKVCNFNNNAGRIWVSEIMNK